MNEMKAKLLISMIVVALATMWTIIAIVIAPILVDRNIPTTGVTASANLEVQANIDWGIVDNNANIFRYGTIKNTGNIPLTLTMTTNIAESWLQCFWNNTNYRLEPSQTVGVQWILQVDNAPANTPFSFNITVNGAQA